jgi:hypothetical protein
MPEKSALASEVRIFRLRFGNPRSRPPLIGESFGLLPVRPVASMLMLHHLSFAVADLSRSATFYDAALAPLGYVRAFTQESGAGRKESAVSYGQPGAEDEFAIRVRQQGSCCAQRGLPCGLQSTFSRGGGRFPSGAGTRRTGQRRRGFSSRTWSELFRRFLFYPDGYRIEAVVDENALESAGAGASAGYYDEQKKVADGAQAIPR